ncbi:MAG: cyclic nucleotide-binding domain-containing protein [Deltaproteobacteria bacterium]|nr:cyclic nucleotide-binding domain-containing protein [Deltaproteobacteria bacterium]
MGGADRIAAIIEDLLSGVSIFEELTPEEMGIVARHMHLLDMGEGELVFEEGEPGSYVCFVSDGDLAVIKDAKSGQRARLATLSRGDSIGEMAVVDRFPRSATVVAETDATLVTLDRDDFVQILSAYPQIGIKMLKGVARLLSMNLRRTSNQLVDYMLPLV